MQIQSYEQLEQSVSDAELVLVGLGEEWVLTEEDILDDLSRKNKFLYGLYLKAKEYENSTELTQLLTAYYYLNYIPDKHRDAYKNLLQLLENKNYFVLSLTIDSYLSQMGFEEERCVNPCGTYEKLQCDTGCGTHLSSSKIMFKELDAFISEVSQMVDFDSQEMLARCLEIKSKYVCETCGAGMTFNSLEAQKYCEEGYLDQWNRYMKWLQGTLNKKLCVIEAGVGMKLPTVIRWPFEKTVFYNQKSKMFRVHEKFYQINEEVSDRAYGCKCNAVHLFYGKKLEAFE